MLPPPHVSHLHSYCPTLYLIPKKIAVVNKNSAVAPYGGVQTSLLVALGSVVASAVLGVMITL